MLQTNFKANKQLAETDRVVQTLELTEAREQGLYGSYVAEQNRLIGGSFYDPDEVELLSGPPAPKAFRPLEDFTYGESVINGGFYTEELDDTCDLSVWYFRQIDDLREMCHLLVKAYNQGHPIYVQDLLQIKLWAADLDTRAEMCGWQLDPFFDGERNMEVVPKTAYERICNDLAELTKVVKRAAKIRVEAHKRTVYLRRIGYLVKEKEVTN